MKIQYNFITGHLVYRGAYVSVVCLMALVGLQLLFASLAGAEQRVWAEPLSLPGGEYEIRKTQLLTAANQPFVDDYFRTQPESELDGYPFSQLNEMDCPKPIDDPNGWSAEFRTGGRPFLNFDVIRINGITWTITPSSYCMTGTSGIPQPVINDHYETGRSVNRLWITHRDNSNGYPTVLAFTPDGFFNPSGAFTPTWQGAAVRAGFIGEPFSPTFDYLQHVDELDIITDPENDTIRFVYSIHSQAGEGVLELTLHWDEEKQRPLLQFRSAHAIQTSSPPTTTLLGFIGVNFMRGSTLHGLLPSGMPGGIEAFHDGRSVFLIQPNGSFLRDLLTPPVYTSTVIRENLAAGPLAGSKLIMDQPQGVSLYFSKFPNPAYENRTDLIVKMISSTVPSLTVRKTQTAVDLSLVNPEANETVNVFYAAELTPGVVAEYQYEVVVEALDFAEQYPARQQGMVFVSNRAETSQKLFFQALDENLLPVGPAVHLTDGVLADVSEPAAAQNGRFIIFDADDYGTSTRQRVYLLDLLTGAVRRLTVDPYINENSDDWGASLNGDNSLFSFITSREGTQNNWRLYIANTQGFASGPPNDELVGFNYNDWNHTANELALRNYLHSIIYLYNPVTEILTNVVTSSGLAAPQLSPSGSRMIYTQAGNVYLLYRPALTSTLVLPNAQNPIWADENHLIVQRTFAGNQELYLFDLASSELMTLTNNLANDIEPTFVPAIGPRIDILSPQTNIETVTPVRVSGFVASVGIPTVTVNGFTATVNGDEWFIELSLPPGDHSITAHVTDSGTGLTDEEAITIRVVDMTVTGAVTGLINVNYVFTAVILPPSTTPPITYTWSASEHPTVIHPNGNLQDTQTLSWAVNGTKNITVTAENGNITLTQTYSIGIFTPVHAGFTADPIVGIAPLTVTFTNTTTGDYTTSQWEFGDGGQSTQTNPIHIYSSPPHTTTMYTVNLTVNGPGGNDVLTKTNFITVYQPVSASFSTSPTFGEPPLFVNFTSAITGAYTNCFWEFGDGATQNSCAPQTSHTYTQTGLYTVTLTVSGPGGTISATQPIHVWYYLFTPVIIKPSTVVNLREQRDSQRFAALHKGE